MIFVQVGRYYCVASNERGQATKSILVTGLASNIRVTSDRWESGRVMTGYMHRPPLVMMS